jgi:hypothetical protein
MAEAGLGLAPLEPQQIREWGPVEVSSCWTALGSGGGEPVASACLRAGVEGGK